MLCDSLIEFNAQLHIEAKLPEGVGILNPFDQPETQRLSAFFYKKFYADHHPRILLFGINPGRLGAGLTGVPFTDPVALEQFCGIENSLQKKKELSSQFIYAFINAYGGPGNFYSHFLFSAVSPLGFVKDGKNLNYYDSKALQSSLEPFIVQSINKQLEMGVNRKVCICLGEGANYGYLSKINEEHHFFDKILPLAHPRYILQYKRKQLNDYIQRYITTSEQALKT